MSSFVPIFLWSFPALLMLVCTAPRNAGAGTLNAVADYDYYNVDSETTNRATGAVTESEFTELEERYTFDINQQLYPNLHLMGGGTLQLRDLETKVDGQEVMTDERLTRPYVDFNLSTPLYLAGLGYRQIDRRQEVGDLPETEDRRKEWNAVLGWRPDAFPQFDIRYLRGHTTDKAESVDSVDNLLLIDTRYDDWKDVGMRYSYTRSKLDDQISNFESLNQTHRANLDYSHSFLDNRMKFGTGYGINYNRTDFPRSGSGAFAILRSAGLSSLDNTPDDGPALQSRTSLIDGEKAASAGIDIGLDGDELTQTNLALDFGFPVPVDRLDVWVDRALPATVSDSFVWSIYTSPDNTDNSVWTLHTTVLSAPFGTFQNRFEISFTEVETRFIKVAVRPLSAAVIGASEFDNIFVTELEALTTLQTSETDKITETIQDYYVNLLYKISDRTQAGYNFFYNLRERDPSSERRTLISNGLYVNHTFSPVYSGTARLSREDNRSSEKPTLITHNYSATLRAAYLETFMQTLTYSGSYETEKEESSNQNTVLIRNIAQLYTGWNAFLDAGISRSRELEGGRVESTTFRVGTDIIPNDKVTLNLSYNVTDSKRESGTKETTSKRENTDLQVFVVPFTTLSLFGRASILEADGERRNFQSFSVNWSPFREGPLQVYYIYSETLADDADQERTERTKGPGLRWNISRHFHMEMSYLDNERETDAEKADSRSFNIKFRCLL